MADPAQIKAWLEGLQAERASKAGETTGVGDLLAILGLTKQPLLTAGALADTAGPLPKFRTKDGEEVEYAMATVPSVKKIARAALLDEALKAGKSGPRTPYHDFLDKQSRLIAAYRGAQPWQKKYAETGEVPVVRVARDITAPSDRRLGAFYNVATPTTKSANNHWLSGNAGATGGEVMYGATANPRNVYMRNDLQGSPDMTYFNLRGKSNPSGLKATDASSEEFANLYEPYRLTKDTLKRLGKLGINRKEAEHIWSAQEGSWARRDAIVSKLLQKEGYDALGEMRPAITGNVMSAPELFKFREPRRNFSYDPRKDKPRGLDQVEFLKQFSKSNPRTPVTEDLLREFAAGRSAQLGKAVPKKAEKAMTASSNVGTSSSWEPETTKSYAETLESPATKIANQWLAEQKLADMYHEIGAKKSNTGKYFKPGFDASPISNITTVLTTEKNPIMQFKQKIPTISKLAGTELLHNEIPGMVMFGNPTAKAPKLSVIPGYSAKVYEGGKKLSKEKALELLDVYTTLFKPKAIAGAPKNTPLDDQIYETLLKSIKQAKR